jgi:hypothetical protein
MMANMPMVLLGIAAQGRRVVRVVRVVLTVLAGRKGWIGPRRRMEIARISNPRRHRATMLAKPLVPIMEQMRTSWLKVI